MKPKVYLETTVSSYLAARPSKIRLPLADVPTHRRKDLDRGDPEIIAVHRRLMHEATLFLLGREILEQLQWRSVISC